MESNDINFSMTCLLIFNYKISCINAEVRLYLKHLTLATTAGNRLLASITITVSMSYINNVTIKNTCKTRFIINN